MSQDGEIVDLLRAKVEDLVLVYRFGSTANRTAHRESDVDLALLAKTRLSSSARWELQSALASALRREVDLVDLRAASTVLQMQVVSSGELLFEGNALERQRFEMLVFSSYARLNEERKAILQRIREEGRVYGR